jgi:mRNA interferase RelE/StbE
MKWLLTHRAWQDYQGAPVSVQKAFDKQVRLLAENLRHPSLRAKKYDQANDIWQARINRDWRFYFQVQGDTYTIIAIIPHPK